MVDSVLKLWHTASDHAMTLLERSAQDDPQLRGAPVSRKFISKWKIRRPDWVWQVSLRSGSPHPHGSLKVLKRHCCYASCLYLSFSNLLLPFSLSLTHTHTHSLSHVLFPGSYVFFCSSWRWIIPVSFFLCMFFPSWLFPVTCRIILSNGSWKRRLHPWSNTHTATVPERRWTPFRKVKSICFKIFLK